MPLKADWIDGDTYTASAINAVATQINQSVTDVTGKQASDADLTAIAALTPANDDFVQRKAGAWTNRTVAQVKADLDAPGNLFNVKSYGAVGGGTTVDTTAFNAAVAAAVAAGGGVVYVPAGTYRISGVALASKIVLRGAGMGITTLKFDTSSADNLVVRVSAGSTTAAQFVGLENLSIDGQMSVITSANVNKFYGFYLGVNSPTVVTDCWVDRVEFYACKAYALDVLEVSRITVTNCTSHDNGFTTGTNNNCSGFEIHANNVMVSNCQASTNSNCGFFVGNGTAHSRVKIVNSIATANAQCGFLIGDTMSDGSVIGCSAYGNTKQGVVVGPNASHAMIMGNTLTANGWQGIDLDTSNNCVISGNVLSANNPGGFDDEIKLEGTAQSTVITGNQILAIATNKCVHEFNTVDFTLMTGNIVTQPSTLIGVHSGSKRLTTVASSATPAINTDLFDVVNIPALAVAVTSFTTNLTGSPVAGQELLIAITGTAARALAWGASFEGSTGAPLPTTTVTTLRLDVSFRWNTVTSKWRCVGVA